MIVPVALVTLAAVGALARALWRLPDVWDATDAWARRQEGLAAACRPRLSTGNQHREELG